MPLISLWVSWISTDRRDMFQFAVVRAGVPGIFALGTVYCLEYLCAVFADFCPGVADQSQRILCLCHDGCVFRTDASRPFRTGNGSICVFCNRVDPDFGLAFLFQIISRFPCTVKKQNFRTYFLYCSKGYFIWSAIR